MDIRKFKELIAKREKIHPEDYLTIEHCDKELIDVLCEDMPGTIKYLYSECTVEEFLWLSEFFEETVARVPDMGYVDGLRYFAQKYPKETKEYRVEYFLNSAQYLIEEIEAQNWPLVKEVVPEASVPALREWLRSHGKLNENQPQGGA